MKSVLRILGLATASVFILKGSSFQTRSKALDQPSKHGARALTEFRARTEEMCHLMGVSVRSFVPVASTSNYQGGAPQHLWRIDCLDGQGKDVLFFIWDADTGDLMYASRQTPIPGKPGAVVLDDRQAAQAVRIWLNKLGVARNRSRRWEMAGEPVRTSKEWRFRWRSGSWLLALNLDALSGDLVLFRTVHSRLNQTEG